MPARRCTQHGNWPNDYEKYKVCPECGEKTDPVNNAEPMGESELNHRLFDVFFKKWDDERVERELAQLEAAVVESDEPGA